jgi:hypothetical protein
MLKLTHAELHAIGVPPMLQPVSVSRGHVEQVLVRQYACVWLGRLVMSAKDAHTAAARSFTL